MSMHERTSRAAATLPSVSGGSTDLTYRPAAVGNRSGPLNGALSGSVHSIRVRHLLMPTQHDLREPS